MTSRSQALDVLRGIAVLMVVLHHYSSVVNDQESALSWLGATGVDLFFVLSGFLISGLLFSEFKRTGSIDVTRFWIRRSFKIYPPFYALIGLTILVCLCGSGRVPRTLAWEALFLQGYLPQFWPHTWSLAVEEHFYLLLPLLLIGMLYVANNRPAVLRICPLLSIAVSVACLCLRFYTVGHDPGWALHGLSRTHLRIDALFAGVAVGYYAHFDERSFREGKRWWVLACGLLLTVSLLVLPYALQLCVAYVAYSCVVAWAANQKATTRNLLARFLAWIGYYSYSIYLWHGVIMLALWRMPRHWAMLPAYIFAVLALGILMAKLIEVPSLRLRDRWFPGTRQDSSVLIDAPHLIDAHESFLV